MGPVDEHKGAQTDGGAPEMAELGDPKGVAAAFKELADAEEDGHHETVVARGNPLLRCSSNKCYPGSAMLPCT
jgi:hypothetical protein